jgi:hypothetical protein
VEETRTDNEKLNQGFQEMASESEWDRHITESQLRQENNDLKKVLVSLQEKNQRMAEAHQSDPPNNLAETENQLSTLSRIEKLEKEKVLHSETAWKWEVTESQLRKEIAELENVVKNHKKALSIKVFEVDSLEQENELLTQNLDSVTTQLEIQLNKLSHLDPELSDEQFATSFSLETQNQEAKQEAIMWRTKFEALQSENRKMWQIREDTLRSGQKAKRLADQQLAALAEALAALQQAIPDAKKAQVTDETIGMIGGLRRKLEFNHYREKNSSSSNYFKAQDPNCTREPPFSKNMQKTSKRKAKI